MLKFTVAVLSSGDQKCEIVFPYEVRDRENIFEDERFAEFMKTVPIGSSVIIDIRRYVYPSRLNRKAEYKRYSDLLDQIQKDSRFIDKNCEKTSSEAFSRNVADKVEKIF